MALVGVLPEETLPETAGVDREGAFVSLTTLEVPPERLRLPGVIRPGTEGFATRVESDLSRLPLRGVITLRLPESNSFRARRA